MSHAQTAAFDRLPWLDDETGPEAERRPVGELAAWAVGATLLVAAASYWMGTRSLDDAQPSAMTVQLPEPRAAVQPQPQDRPEPAPRVEPMAAPPMPVIDRPAPVKQAAPKAARASQRPSMTRPQALQPWPARAIDGAAGRLVRVGTFATARQAKRGWWSIVRVNPALQHLPALVVAVRSLRDGRIYYRLQMGTTSQAHSEVLCQRMRMIAVSCVVIGLDQAKVAA